MMIELSMPTISYVEGAPGLLGQLIVPTDHIVPPGPLDIAFEFHPQRAIVPKTIEPAVDLARLKQESAPATERNQFFRFPC